MEKYGSPDVLQLVTIEKPQIGEKEVLIQVKAIGVNYADAARREGKYVIPTELPFIPGAEIAGEIIEVGAKVERFKPGMRVVSLIESHGYAEYAVAPEAGLAIVPESVDFTDAVALPLQGQTAYHVLKTMGRLQEGETVLIHAAAGGVGTLAVQLAKIFGAGKIIATASTDEKLELAKKLGADVLINYTEKDWEDQVREVTDGKGVDVALEMVGGEFFQKTLRCMAPFGRLVIFGAASGEQSQLYPGQLMKRNQSVIGFFLPQIMRDPALYRSSFEELLGYVADGRLKLVIGGVYPLEEAPKVHRLLQGRQTIGKQILIP